MLLQSILAIIFVLSTNVYGGTISHDSVTDSTFGAALETVQDDFECRSSIALNESTAIVNSVQERYSSIDEMEADFTQDSYLASLDLSEISHGKVSFLKPGMMRWDYLDPRKQVFIVKDSTVWLYQVAEMQVMIDRFKDVLLSDLPVSFLMGLGSLSNDFNVESGCKKGNQILLRFSPKSSHNKEVDKPSVLARFALMVDATEFQPVAVEVLDSGGNKTKIFLSNIRINARLLTAGNFKADFPKGVDITDRREIF